ncbi:MAG: carbon-nitrogen hydrolase family protein [Caldilineaceae bacterium]|nr:carbon-nitrogen hydrolase family protein [Caldilineaceae bacterium]
MHDQSLVTVAASQYPVEFIGSWQRYAAKIEQLICQAVEQGAEIILFPEYGCLELASLFPHKIYGDLQRQLVALQSLVADYRNLHRQLACKYGIYLVSSSFPIRLEDGSYRNRAYFCFPDGTLDYQDKLIMTRWEREQWNISPGQAIKVFRTRFGLVGINICYDSEFPLIARAQVEMGAKLILTPSFTEASAGYHRVRIGCRARALENQCYVVMSPLVGDAEWTLSIEHGYGRAGIFTPVDVGFPEDGILAQGTLNQPQWVISQIDLATVDIVREHGNVTNYADWAGQHRLTPEPLHEDWLTPALVTSMAYERKLSQKLLCSADSTHFAIQQEN